ncbi:Non-hemolytic phospholipase C [Cellulomonas sp. T2.31MG-18]
MHRMHRVTAVGAASLAVAGLVVASATASSAHDRGDEHSQGGTATPIKHLVVIFNENVSFDHYFATYPNAANTDGTRFTAAHGTPRANTLQAAGLLTSNPNSALPQRLSSSQAMTCDQNHGYSAEQKAADGGRNDLYVQNTDVETCTPGLFTEPGLVMDYYDGNTVTGLWNYAQHYAMSDNSYSTTFGPSTPGAINLISGQTHGIRAVTPTGTPTTDSYVVASPDANGVGTVINDPDPYYDDCSNSNATRSNNLAVASGKNVGDLLNAKGVTWGWFQGGFKPTTPYAGPGTKAVCGAKSTNIGGGTSLDYSPHHSPFEYYASTSNPHHLAPSSVAAIGHTDQANHNYDVSDFDAALAAGNLPAVSFVKAPEYQDGHAGYSDPIDEQHFLVKEINALQKSPEWSSTAVVVAYDDSDGWYDHQSAVITNGSNDPARDAAICTSAAAAVGVAGGYADRCGPGTRQPLLVISPFSKTNYVDHTQTDQASILSFVETNWGTGRIGDFSADAKAGSLGGLFNFHRPVGRQVLLNTDGSVASVKVTAPRHD